MYFETSISIPRWSRSCIDTSGKSARLSPDKRHHILVRSGKLQTSSRRDGAKRTRPGRDGPGRSACTLSALRLDQPPKPARGILHEPRMRRPFSDASVQMQTSSQRRLQSLRRRYKIPSNGLCSIRTKYDISTNSKLASRIERAPRLLSARLVIIDELHCPDR